MRYGENILEVQAAGAWECPPCRGLCNCSFHRIRRGWAPTGTLYRRAIAEGALKYAFLHVSHSTQIMFPRGFTIQSYRHHLLLRHC